MKAASALAVLGMGGTIDKDYPRTTMGYAFEIDEPAATRVFSGMPFIGVEWRVESICRKDSTEIVAADRESLAAAVRRAPERRIIVTHGTDTLIQTAQFIQDCGAAAGKAVAFTGAMKPERFKDSDASFNVGAACAATDLLPDGSVVVVMGGRAIAAERCVRNTETGSFDEVAPDGQGSKRPRSASDGP
jgi:L-asparaginase